MSGFGGSTGVTLKQMQDAIAQSTANLIQLSNGPYGVLSRGWCKQFGKLVIFDVVVSAVSSGASTGQGLVTGFPAVAESNMPILGVKLGVENSFQGFRMYSGGLYPNSTLAGDTYYHIYGSYISA